MKNATFSILIGILILSCEEAELSREVESIKYGTSFGMCVGYCLTDVEVSATGVNVTTYGWDNSVAPKAAFGTYTESEFQALLESIDVEKYLELEPVIGCPDCADGGAEWIELTASGRTKKVTFEYGAEVDGLTEALAELRAITLANRPE